MFAQQVLEVSCGRARDSCARQTVARADKAHLELSCECLFQASQSQGLESGRRFGAAN